MDRLLASDGNTRNFPLTAWANVELSGGVRTRATPPVEPHPTLELPARIGCVGWEHKGAISGGAQPLTDSAVRTH